MRLPEPALLQLLSQEAVVTHPFIIGELGMGTLGKREATLEAIRKLPQLEQISDDEVQVFVERQRLFGSGIGYLDAHLLASAQIAADVFVWTRDRKLLEAARRIKMEWQEPAVQ